MHFSAIRTGGAVSAIALILAGCASKKTTTGLGTAYQAANQAAITEVASESSQAKRVRRIGAIIAYINKPDLTINDNLNKSDVDGSFINFVCTGADDFETTTAGLKYTAEYANTIKAITTAPEDSISGYIAALSALRSKGKPLALPDISTKQFEKCRDDVQSDVPPKGITAVGGRQETPIVAAIAAIQAMQTLITSVEALIKDGLKLATEAEQKAALKAFIENNQADYQKVLSNDLSSQELASAFGRRRQIAVAAPYFEFKSMMALSPQRDQVAIIKMATEIDQGLGEYDSIRVQAVPESIVEQFKSINQKLSDYANGKITLSDLIQFLSEMADELQATKKDYDAVDKAVPAALTAVGIK